MNISIRDQVKLLNKVLEKMNVEFDNEQDRMDFILDICNEYRKELENFNKECLKD